MGLGRRGLAGFFALVAALSAGGCSVLESTCKEDDRDCLAPTFKRAIGGECLRISDCRDGLFCIEGSCQPNGESIEGQDCLLSAECSDGLYCTTFGELQVTRYYGTCQPEGPGAVGDSCLTVAECQAGLTCLLRGFEGGKCVMAGDVDYGMECAGPGDCMAGLICLPTLSKPGEFSCNKPPGEVEMPNLPYWDGVQCEKVAEDDPAEALFAVPRTGEEPGEFYSLPFPNDVRLKNGKLDLSGHPAPPDSTGLPLLKRYLDAAEQDMDGFSTNAVAYFRFSHEFDWESVDDDTVDLVDITPGSPTYDTQEPLLWKTTKGNVSQYICPHWLALRRPTGTVLRPRTTYAAIVTTGVRQPDNKPFRRSADLDRLLSDAAPADPDLAHAHQVYAPLRAWLAETATDPATILNAAVFTTHDPEAVLPALRQVVRDEGAASVSDLTLCDGETKSPCEDASGRGACHAPGTSVPFHEIHGRIRLPNFQHGTAPYLEPEAGGGFELDSDGKPVPSGSIDVCFALAIPKAAEPPAGYPVMIHGHGTNGAFSSQLSPGGLAYDMATAGVPAATLAIDLPQHGARRGESSESPEILFYNFLNPRAARDNVMQGSADMLGLVQWVGAGGLSAGESPTGEAIRFDTEHIALFGHSQGATHAALVASYEPDLDGVLLSGVGGHLISSLLAKKSPIDVASVLPFVLFDPDGDELAADSYNPALALIQMYFDRVDPINYAHRLRSEPSALNPGGVDLFMTYGLDDSYSPEDTQQAYAKAGRLTHVENVLVPMGLQVASEPLTMSDTLDGQPRTIGVRQYAPVEIAAPTEDTSDETKGQSADGTTVLEGHFVSTRDPVARGHVVRFVSQVLAGQRPQIGD
jgi:pimeloyl-ACP methyl ester carboxylesterase